MGLKCPEIVVDARKFFLPGGIEMCTGNSAAMGWAEAQVVRDDALDLEDLAGVLHS